MIWNIHWTIRDLYTGSVQQRYCKDLGFRFTIGVHFSFEVMRVIIMGLSLYKLTDDLRLWTFLCRNYTEW